MHACASNRRCDAGQHPVIGCFTSTIAGNLSRSAKTELKEKRFSKQTHKRVRLKKEANLSSIKFNYNMSGVTALTPTTGQANPKALMK